MLVESHPGRWDGYAGYVHQATLDKGERIVRQARRALTQLIAAWLRAPLPEAPKGQGRR